MQIIRIDALISAKDAEIRQIEPCAVRFTNARLYICSTSYSYIVIQP